MVVRPASLGAAGGGTCALHGIREPPPSPPRQSFREGKEARQVKSVLLGGYSPMVHRRIEAVLLSSLTMHTRRPIESLSPAANRLRLRQLLKAHCHRFMTIPGRPVCNGRADVVEQMRVR